MTKKKSLVILLVGLLMFSSVVCLFSMRKSGWDCVELHPDKILLPSENRLEKFLQKLEADGDIEISEVYAILGFPQSTTMAKAPAGYMTSLTVDATHYVYEISNGDCIAVSYIARDSDSELVVNNVVGPFPLSELSSMEAN